MKNYIQEGDRMPVVLTAAATSGSVIVVGAKAFVSQDNGVIGDTVTVYTKGVFELPKATGAVAQGALVYYNATSKNITTTNTDVAIGYAFKAAASGDATVQVSLK